MMERAFHHVPVDFMAPRESVQLVQLVAKAALQIHHALHALLDSMFLRTTVFQVAQRLITQQLVYVQLAQVGARIAQFLLGVWFAPQLLICTRVPVCRLVLLDILQSPGFAQLVPVDVILAAALKNAPHVL